MVTKLCEYKGLTLGKEEVKPVTEQELTAALNSLVERSTTYEEVEKAAELGDMTNIDFEGFVDGVAFEGGKGEKYDLVLGSNSFIPGFEDQLVGTRKGQTIDVNVTFPKEYHAENLKGKQAVFKCVVNQVKVKKVASLDDEFAKAHGLNTIEELREAVKAEIADRNMHKSQSNYFDKLCSYLIDNSEVEVTKEAEEKSRANVIAYYKQMVSMYGMGLEQYLQMCGQTMESFHTTIEPEVIKGAKVNLILAQIANLEKLSTSDEEVENELLHIKNTYKLSDEQFNEFKTKNREDVKFEITKAHVIKFLVDSNN